MGRQGGGDEHKQEDERGAGDDPGAAGRDGGQEHEDHGRPGDEPGRVELVEDVGDPQHPVEPDRRQQQPEREQDGADDVEHHQNGPPRVT
jgi:hypothetical protein